MKGIMDESTNKAETNAGIHADDDTGSTSGRDQDGSSVLQHQERRDQTSTRQHLQQEEIPVEEYRRNLIREKQAILLTELSEAVNTLTSLEEILAELLKKQHHDTGSLVRKRKELLEELEQWKNLLI